MRAVDTNILVRILIRDDENQLAAAEAFIRQGAWVSHLVLAETLWVVASVYNRTHAELIRAIEMLISHEHFVLEDAESVSSALENYKKKPSLRFTDCLILESARKAGHLPLGTFDQRLAKLDGVQKL